MPAVVPAEQLSPLGRRLWRGPDCEERATGPAGQSSTELPPIERCVLDWFHEPRSVRDLFSSADVSSSVEARFVPYAQYLEREQLFMTSDERAAARRLRL